ncbi:hypothetical protein AVEN_154228-1 [Araneus ventricosus]|uniref:Uncharacterized protein n=1 Tax=Araneus ventricosus TaxID=182803 RepID=A0A4Y2GV03_ARAVE|nr:hypothetical protein AVEN_154228-1 [Araneus ventricosus]
MPFEGFHILRCFALNHSAHSNITLLHIQMFTTSCCTINHVALEHLLLQTLSKNMALSFRDCPMHNVCIVKNNARPAFLHPHAIRSNLFGSAGNELNEGLWVLDPF